MQDKGHQDAVITVVGHDQVGLIARVAGLLAEAGINIKDISQTIMNDMFTMIMMVDLSRMDGDIRQLAQQLEALGRTLEVSIRVQHADIFDAMHRI